MASATSNDDPFWGLLVKALLKKAPVADLFVDFQDRLETEDFRREVRSWLDELRGDLSDVVERLRNERADVTVEEVDQAALDVAEGLYLAGVAREYFYSDFKGIEQLEKFVSMKLDEIFVDLKVRPERIRGREERELLAELQERDHEDAWLADLEVRDIGADAEAFTKAKMLTVSHNRSTRF